MGLILMNVGAFDCEAPIIGTTYRQQSTTGNYLFNWTSKASLYASWGLNVQITLWYLPDGNFPYQQYTATPIPFDATNFVIENINLGNPDVADFRVVLEIDNATTCAKQEEIPYSSIIIT